MTSVAGFFGQYLGALRHPHSFLIRTHLPAKDSSLLCTSPAIYAENRNPSLKSVLLLHKVSRKQKIHKWAQAWSQAENIISSKENVLSSVCCIFHYIIYFV